MTTLNTFEHRNSTIAFAALILILMGFWVRYILQVDPVLPVTDQYPLLQEYAQFKKEGLSFELLWSTKGGHLYPGYKLTFFLNCLLFGFSPKLEIFVSLFFFAVAIFYIVHTFASEIRLPQIVVILFGLAVMLMFTNGQTAYQSTYSLVATRLMNFAFFVFASMMCFKFVSEERPTLKNLTIKGVLFFAVLCVVILFFGRGWGIAAIVAMAGLTGLHFLSNWIQEKFEIRPHILVLISVLLILLIYFARNDASADGPLNLTKAGAFALTKFGNAGLGMFDHDLSRVVAADRIASVLFLVLTILFSLNYLFRQRVTKAIWLAFFLVYFSIIATLLVAVSRYSGSPFFPRHNIEMSIGWVGMLFLIFKFMDEKLTGQLRFILPGLLAILFAVPAGISSHKNYDSHKFVKNYYLRLKDNYIAAYTEPSKFEKEFKSIGCPRNRQTCLSILEIMKENGISRSVIEDAQTDLKIDRKGNKGK